MQMVTNLETLGRRLKQLRQERKLTQKQFVEGLSITAPTLSAYEKGTANPSISAITEIAIKHNVSIDWLMGLSDKNFINRKIETYADLAKSIYDIVCITDMRITLEAEARFEVCSGNDFSHYEFYDAIKFKSNNPEFKKFISDLQRMKDLLNDNTIDIKLFELWIEKEYNEFGEATIKDGEKVTPQQTLPLKVTPKKATPPKNNNSVDPDDLPF